MANYCCIMPRQSGICTKPVTQLIALRTLLLVHRTRSHPVGISIYERWNWTVTKLLSSRNNIIIGTWNVRTLYQAGKIQNVIQEMDRIRVNIILGVCETRWDTSGTFLHDGHTVIYSGGDKNVRGVGMILDQKASRSLLGYWPM